MRVFISADIEGVAGICHWDEADKSHRDYPHFRQQMQAEVRAACLGAFAAGATLVRVKDAHASGRNLRHNELPNGVELVRAWGEHPLSMVQELDASFDALAFVGYHDCAGSSANPLAHTMTGRVSEMRVNGTPVAEFHLHAWAAAELGVPTVFVSGDAGLCERVADWDIATVATNIGLGRAILAPHPDGVVRDIRARIEEALRSPGPVVELPEEFELELDFREVARAYRAQWYPGAELVGERTVRVRATRWYEVMRALVFMP
jgi:D-amino peptidase